MVVVISCGCWIASVAVAGGEISQLFSRQLYNYVILPFIKALSRGTFLTVYDTRLSLSGTESPAVPMRPIDGLLVGYYALSYD